MISASTCLSGFPRLVREEPAKCCPESRCSSLENHSLGRLAVNRIYQNRLGVTMQGAECCFYKGLQASMIFATSQCDGISPNADELGCIGHPKEGECSLTSARPHPRVLMGAFCVLPRKVLRLELVGGTHGWRLTEPPKAPAWLLRKKF